MSVKYSFNNWYSWFKKPDEIDRKHVANNLVGQIRINDKEIIRSLNRYTNSKRNVKDTRASIKKSKTSLIVRRHKRKKHTHHTLQPRKDAYSNKLHKTEFGNCSSSKHYRHYISPKSINDRNNHRNQDKQFNRQEQTHSMAGDMTTEKHCRRENPSKYRKTIQTREIDRIGEKQKPSRNKEVTQIKTRNKPLGKESMEIMSPRIKNALKNENRFRGVDSAKFENTSFITDKEITQKVIDLTTTSRDEARNSAHLSAGRNVLRKKEENLINHSIQKKMCHKPIRTESPEPSSENPVMCLFSKVWPSDNSDEKIAKENGQIPGKNNMPTSIIHNKSKPAFEREKQDSRRKTKIASSNSIDSKKKGIVKNNRNLRFEDENGKGKFKRNYSKPKDSKTEKINNYSPKSHKRLEQVDLESDGKHNIDSMNFISILKEIKSLKDQLKSLSDDDESKDYCETRTKTAESKRILECIEEESNESPNSEPMVPKSSDLQSFVTSPTVGSEKKSPKPLNNDGAENLISSVQSAQQVTAAKSVAPDMTHNFSCHISPLLLPPPIALNDQEQTHTGNPCETVVTGLENTKDFSICQSPAKCLNFKGLVKHDCNLFLNRRIFNFKNYIPASERKNKKEVLMKKRLLSRLRTCNIPIKRKLDASSSLNLRKIRCSSSSKEDIVYEAPAYDFSPFLKRNIPYTSFLERNSSVNPFIPYSDISRCTSTSIITQEKVWSYMCNIDVDKRAKSDGSLKYLKEPKCSTTKLKVFENSANEKKSKINKKSIKLLDRRNRYDRRPTIKNKQKSKMKTKKAKRKQKTNENQVDNVLKIENLSSHSNSIWKTISIEFNDVSLNCENPLSEYRLQLMLSEITEYLKTKSVQPIIADVNIDSGIDNDLQDKNVTQQTSKDDDQLEPLVTSDACLDDFIIIDDYSASEKSSQTSTNDPPSTSDTDIKNPYVEIAREIQLLHENNQENKKEIEKIKEILNIKFPWLEKTIFDILTHYQNIPTDLPFMGNIEQVCYSISNFTFRKSLSNSKNCNNYEYQQIKKFKMFSGSNSSARELGNKFETIEYHPVENSLEHAKNDNKSKISHFTKNIRRIFRVFVGKKKH